MTLMKSEELKNSMVKMLDALIPHSNSKKENAKRKYKYVIHEGFPMMSDEDLNFYVARSIALHSDRIAREIDGLDEIVIEEFKFFKSEDFEGYVLQAVIYIGIA